jgi:hypothetical protein
MPTAPRNPSVPCSKGGSDDHWHNPQTSRRWPPCHRCPAGNVGSSYLESSPLPNAELCDDPSSTGCPTATCYDGWLLLTQPPRDAKGGREPHRHPPCVSATQVVSMTNSDSVKAERWGWRRQRQRLGFGRLLWRPTTRILTTWFHFFFFVCFIPAWNYCS